nr:hypothetical protein CFP56_03769 [Quercus suber]
MGSAEWEKSRSCHWVVNPHSQADAHPGVQRGESRGREALARGSDVLLLADDAGLGASDAAASETHGSGI